MDRITVTVLKWDKFNPRKDYRTPIWFALSNRVLEDPDLFDLDPIEFKTFIYILCQASQQKDSTCEIRFSHAERVSNIDRATLLRTIEKLQQNQIVQMLETICTEACDDPYRGSETSVRHTTVQDSTVQDKTDITAPPVQKLTAPPPTAIAVAPAGKELTAAYCEHYKARYGVYPVIRPQDGRALKTLAATVGKERGKALIAAYLQMANSWFITKSHDVTTLIQNLNQVQNFLETGQVITTADARAAESSDSLRNQVERLKKGAV